uniref:calpain-2 n=1 Tax=Erpetoichthys calabaricus TaxID=27687 RepID=A0A8C4T7U1_ERPCA
MSSMADKVAKERARVEGHGTNQLAVKYLQQDYESLKAQCLRSGTLFKDDSFPAVTESLGFNELGPHSAKTRGIEWKRPKELCANPQFIIGGATRTDVCQGALGDCWLLAAIASLTLDEEILARVVPSGQSFQENYAGIFHFQFWQYGEWVDVVIDDRLPTRNGELLFVHSAEGTEFWSALLEKAYAKLNGSYEALSGGSTIEGFEDFTGGISELYMLHKAPPHLFKVICKALSAGSLLGCSIDITSARDTEAVTFQKLVKGHAYSLTGAEEVSYRSGKEKIVRIRNPWGQVEWTGAWSDNAPEWNYVTPEEKSKLDCKAEDGEFWMSYSDFLTHYSKLEICNLSPDTLSDDSLHKWTMAVFEGNWRVGSTAGGCINSPATFCSNPQFTFKLDEEDDEHYDNVSGCSFLLGLMQKNTRKEKRFGRDLNTIGFAIYKVPEKFKGCSNVHLGADVLLRQKAVAMSSAFINLREQCDRFKLPPGEYIVVPSTFEPHKNGNFVLRFCFEKNAVASRMEHPIDAKIFEPEITEREIDPHFRQLFMQVAGKDSEITVFELIQILNQVTKQRADIKCDGFTLETCRNIISLLDKDGNGTLGLVEFTILWEKLRIYLEIFKKFDTDGSGTMSSHEMRGAVLEAGFQLNNELIQAVVHRFSDDTFSVDFDSFVGCLIRLEMLFKMFNIVDTTKSGTIQLTLGQWLLLGMY